MRVESTWQPRVRCLRCRRPEATCYCALVPRLETTTRVVILQHTRERDMPIGTARMASLALPNAELHVGVRWGEHPGLARALSDPARPPILLYPGPGAKDILTEPPVGPVTLVVVDGTWSQAKTIVRDNPILHALPRYAFSAPEPSRYRIRREPRPEYCSTIEALMHVLGVLEHDTPRFRALLVPFETMIDNQLAAETTATNRGPRKQRPKPVRSRMPRELTQRWDDLVCIVGEANAWPYVAGTSHPPDELIHWLAIRPADGSVFDAVIRPRAALSPSTPFHSELTEAELAAGRTVEDMLAAFAAWSRPTDIACAWGGYGPALFAAAGGVLSTQLDLRHAAQRIENRRIGSLEHYAGDVAAIAAGRGGVRLAMLANIVRGWRARLVSPPV